MKPSGKHGPTYHSWSSAKSRCRNPNAKSYASYGGRGIKFSPLWDDYADFLRDMGERPAGTSIDRIDNNGHYEKGNCRWSTQTEQCRNTRANVLYEYEGRTICIAEIAEATGINDAVIRRRLENGWALDRATSVEVSCEDPYLTPLQVCMIKFQRRRRELEAAGIDPAFPLVRERRAA